MSFAAPTSATHQWVVDLFTAAGSSPQECTILADHLVANLSGHDSHGVGMAPRYVNALLNGEMTINQPVHWALDSGNLLVADGGNGVGQAAAHQAMSKAIGRAREQGIALLGLRNSHHIGRVGHWAEMATDAAMVSVHFTSAMSPAPIVAPYGGAQARYVTNPFTVGIPRGNGEPLILDFATSAIAHGKARVAYNKGVEVPEGSLIDASGEPTRNPDVLFSEPMGALKTFAEHKGHALAVVCELLGAALTGGPTMRPGNFSKRYGAYNNMMAIVFDPAQLGTGSQFAAETEGFIEWVQSAQLDSHGRKLGGVLMPGDPERRMRVERAELLPIDDGTMAELDRAAEQVREAFQSGPGPLSALC